MDDLVEVLFGIFLAVLIIVALIYVVIYVAIPAALFYFLGKQLHRQLTEYRLVGKTWVVLAAIGVLSIIIATAIVAGNAFDSLFIAPISALIFLLAAIPTLAVWAYSKKSRFYDLRNSLRSEINSLETRERQLEQTISSLTGRSDRIQSQYGSAVQEIEKLKGYAEELCGTDARIYTIKRREWEADVGQCDNRALELIQKRLSSSLRNTGSGSCERVEQSIRLCLVKAELKKRLVKAPWAELEANKRRLQDLQRDRETVKSQLAGVKAASGRNETALASFVSQKITLD